MKPQDAKVLIGMPNYTNLIPSEVYANHIECVRTWTDMGLDFQFLVAGRNFVHFARSRICQAAVDGGWTHILWLDDDAVIDPMTLPRFLEHDKDVVIAPYPMRRSPFEVGVLVSRQYSCPDDHGSKFVDATFKELDDDFPTCDVCGKEMERDFHNHAAYKNICARDLDSGLRQIDGGGTHCMLITVDCLTRKPNKDAVTYPPDLVKMMEGLNAEERTILDHNIGNLPDIDKSFKDEDDDGRPYFVMPKSGTEDMLWCYRAKSKGFEVWCDTDVFANHVGFAPVVTREFRESMEDRGDGEPVDVKNGVAILEIQEGRDHTKLVKGKDASLI